MEYYEGFSIKERKKISRKNILSMWDRNQKRFEENMKKEEMIDGIVNEMCFIKSKSTNE